MTPEERAVVQAAMAYRYKLLANPRALDVLHNTNNPLTSALSEIAWTTWRLATSCPRHAGADGSCPDYGSRLDPCPPGCASGTCVAGWGSRPAPGTVCDNCAPALLRASTTRVDGSEPKQRCHTCGNTVDEAYLSIGCCAGFIAPSGAMEWCAQCPLIKSQSVGPEDDGALRDELAAVAAANEPIWVPRTWADVRTGDDVRLPGTENYAHVHRAVHLHWHVDPRTGTSSYNPPQPMSWSGVHVTLYTKKNETTGNIDVQASEFTMDPAKPIEIKTTQLELDAIELIGGWPARVGVITNDPQ
jgi:hypothetical protein